MSAEPYSAEVRELFRVTAHAGSVEGGPRADVEDQGVRISLSAELDGGVVRALRFEAWGCPHVIATSEAFCANYEGRSAADLLDFSATDLMQSLSVPVEKTGRILVIEDAVRSLGSVVRGDSDPND